MSKTKTLVLIPMSNTDKQIITQFSDHLDIIFKDMNEVTITREDIDEAEIIIGYPPRKYLKMASKLRWLQTITAGVETYLTDNILSDDIILTNASGSYGESQSEFMFSMLISLMKKLHIYRDNQQDSRWLDEGDVMMLRGSTAIVIGLGDIGSEFARLLKAFGVYVIGVRRDSTKNCVYADEIYSFTDLDRHIHRADILGMVIPATPETVHLMDANRIAMMKEGSILVNTGRGTTVDNEALCDELESGRLAGAALDVFEPEPIPVNHRAWKIKNLLITPHAAGQDFMPHNWQKTLQLIEDNLRAYNEGKELRNIVDRSIYEFKS